jgi:hypothetical protein
MTATGWWQFGQFWTALGGCPPLYPAVQGSSVCVTTFAVLFVSVPVAVAWRAGPGCPVAASSRRTARHQRALHLALQKRWRGLPEVQVNVSPQAAQHRVAVVVIGWPRLS